MDVCLAWTNIELTIDTNKALDFVGQEQKLYVGRFNNGASHVLDCFDFSLDNTRRYEAAHLIPTLEISPLLSHGKLLKTGLLEITSPTQLT